MRLVDFFDRIYVINLPARKDRLKLILKELETLGISNKSNSDESNKLEIFSAIRPKDGAGFFTSIGVRGCYLSHLGVLKKAKADGVKRFLVVEDDLKLADNFRQLEEQIVQHLEIKDWDIAHLACSRVMRKVPNTEDDWRQMSPDDLLSESEYSLNDLPALFRSKDLVVGAQLYGVQANALDQLIDLFEDRQHRPNGHPDGGAVGADGMNSFEVSLHYPNLIRVISLPTLGDQHSSRSDISPRWFDQIPIVGLLAQAARNATRAVR